MTLLIKASELASRAIRKQATGGKPRLLDLGRSFLEQRQNRSLVARIWSAAIGAKNFLFSAIKAFARTVISAKNIFMMLLSSGTVIVNFNWNATDADLKQSVRNQNIAIASAWGSAAGRTAGWLTGIAIGAGIAFVCPVIGGAALASGVALALAPEAIEEISQGLLTALGTTARAVAVNAVTYSYLNLRKFIKSLPLETLQKVLGPERAKALKYEWGKEGGPVWTLSGKAEERVEKISSPEARAFTESFIDEAFDSFIEAGFIVAAEIDNAYEQSRQANQQQLGPTRIVEITPDKNNEAEKIILAGDEKLIRPQILQTISNHRLIHNRDIGQYMGEPVEDSQRARWLNRKICIVFRDKPTPPWRHPNGKRCKQAIYSIPDTKVGVKWKDIKAAASSYQWGRFLATGRLDNGRRLQVYGATEAAAEKKLRQLLKLSTAELTSLNVSEEKLRNPRKRKDTTIMYPSFASVLIRSKSTDQQGRADSNGVIFDEKLIKFDLYTDEEPPGIPPLNLV